MSHGLRKLRGKSAEYRDSGICAIMRGYVFARALTKYDESQALCTHDELAEKLAEIEALPGKRRGEYPENPMRRKGLYDISVVDFVAWLRATPVEQWPEWIDTEKPLVVEIVEPGTIERERLALSERIKADALAAGKAKARLDEAIQDASHFLHLIDADDYEYDELRLLMNGANRIIEE